MGRGLLPSHQNIHLVAKWLGALEKKLEEHSENSHREFRVFMSAEPAPSPGSHIVPQGLLENAIKITSEPPTGMHANLHKALDNFTQVGSWREGSGAPPLAKSRHPPHPPRAGEEHTLLKESVAGHALLACLEGPGRDREGAAAASVVQLLIIKMIKLCLGRFSIILSASPGALVFGLTPVQAQCPVLVIEQLGRISQEMLAFPGSAAEGYTTVDVSDFTSLCSRSFRGRGTDSGVFSLLTRVSIAPFCICKCPGTVARLIPSRIHSVPPEPYFHCLWDKSQNWGLFIHPLFPDRCAVWR